MKYKYYILSTQDDFYMADAICRELEKTGASCYYNIRDSKKANRMPDNYDIIESETSLISVVNDEFISNHSLSSSVSFYSKKTSEDKVFVLQNGYIKDYPEQWNRFRWVDATKGLNHNIMQILTGSVPGGIMATGNEAVAIPANTGVTAGFVKQSNITQEYDQTQVSAGDEENVCYRVGKPDADMDSLIVMEDGLPLTVQRAIRYIKGDGVPQDDERAYSLLKKAVSEVPVSFKAQFYFGLCSELEFGGGKPEDAGAAYEKAIELGKDLGEDISDVTKRLAMVRYDAGEFNEARNLLSEVTSSDPIFASYCLGLIDEAEGKYEEAIEHYSEAAESGYLPAQNAIGCLYAEGKGVKVDERKSLQWFVMAANAGLTEALVNAGVRLVRYDDEESFTCGEEMLQVAADRGNQTARSYMMEIEEMRIAEQREMELESKRQEQSRNRGNDDDDNDGNDGGSALGEFIDALDLPGLAAYAKSRFFG